ncbi:MAG: Zn-dependent hydrolase [Bacteroidales bacterium]|nr:Zn-dependent hydrolase [Candidatus Colimorpha onthohippi]
MKKIMTTAIALTMLAAVGCKNKQSQEVADELQQKVDEYAEYTLTTDLSSLSDHERQLIPIFVQIAEIMDDLYWEQTFGNENRANLDTITNPAMREFAQIHYGAWDRLDGEKPFIPGFGERPKGATFYPVDMTAEEFEALQDPAKKSEYTVIRRDEQGALKVVPYHVEYAEQLAKVDSLLALAIDLADDPGLKTYLTERRKAFQTDDYYASDLAWMDMKQSKIDFIVGPIENYEDALYGYKTAYESFILIKDEKWSNDLAKFVGMLPELQQLLPCDPAYKPALQASASESDLNVYDVVYYAGDCNAASKTIAINLPNDERIHSAKGCRRLQLKNAMQAKFDKILKPIADLFVCQQQLDNINFDAFFSNVTFHEVAHGLGIKNTVGTNQTLRDALREQYSPWEESKADICGLFLTQTLIEKGEITNCSVEDAYVTFIAGILRSVRFGATEAHGIANMMCFNYLQDNGAFSRDSQGKYVINVEQMREAINSWAALILKVEGTGDYTFAKDYATQNGIVREDLQNDLNAIAKAGIPRDIRYNQGLKALGLK